MNAKVVTYLYTDKKLRALTRNISLRYGAEYAEDLHCEVVLRIIDSGDDLDQISDLYHYFFAYAHRTINEYKISKKYGYNYNRIDGQAYSDKIGTRINYEYKLQPSDQLEELLKPSDSDTFRDDYKKKLFKIYLEEGNYRAVAKSTKIPLRNVAKTLMEFKNELLKKIE